MKETWASRKHELLVLRKCISMIRNLETQLVGAQWIKCLLCKPKDLSSIPESPCKSPGIVVYTCWRTEAGSSLVLSRQSVSLAELRVPYSMGDSLKNKVV